MRIVIQGKTIINNTKGNDDSKLSFAISYMVLLLFLTNSAAFLERMIGGVSYQNVNLFVWVSLFFVLLYDLPAIIRNLRKKTIFLIIFTSTLFLVNYLMIGDNEIFVNVVRRFFLTVFPVLIVAISIHKYDVLLDQLMVVSKVILPFAIILFFTSINQSYDYRMGLSYSLQLPTIMMFYSYYKTKEISNIIFAFTGILIIIMLGARGPLLGIALFVILLLLKSFNMNRNAATYLLFVLCLLLLIASSNFIFESLLNLSQTYGFRSRTLFLLANDVLHDSGRSRIYRVIIEEILNNPFKIHGITSEYAFTGGFYAHNFILELLFDFGIFFGGIAVSFIIYRAFKTIYYFLKRGDANDIAIFILFSNSFLSALVSGSIWGSVYFWLWLVMNKERLTISSKHLNT